MGSGGQDHKALAPESDELPEAQLELFFGCSTDKAGTAVDTGCPQPCVINVLFAEDVMLDNKSCWSELDLPACEGT